MTSFNFLRQLLARFPRSIRHGKLIANSLQWKINGKRPSILDDKKSHSLAIKYWSFCQARGCLPASAFPLRARLLHFTVGCLLGEVETGAFSRCCQAQGGHVGQCVGCQVWHGKGGGEVQGVVPSPQLSSGSAGLILRSHAAISNSPDSNHSGIDRKPQAAVTCRICQQSQTCQGVSQKNEG